MAPGEQRLTYTGNDSSSWDAIGNDARPVVWLERIARKRLTRKNKIGIQFPRREYKSTST